MKSVASAMLAAPLRIVLIRLTTSTRPVWPFTSADERANASRQPRRSIITSGTISDQRAAAIRPGTSRRKRPIDDAEAVEKRRPEERSEPSAVES